MVFKDFFADSLNHAFSRHMLPDAGFDYVLVLSHFQTGSCLKFLLLGYGTLGTLFFSPFWLTLHYNPKSTSKLVVKGAVPSRAGVKRDSSAAVVPGVRNLGRAVYLQCD